MKNVGFELGTLGLDPANHGLATTAPTNLFGRHSLYLLALILAEEVTERWAAD